MSTIFIEGLEVFGYHGVTDEERVVGHRFRIDLRIDVPETAGQTDDVVGTVDYGLAAHAAQTIVARERFRTVERLASAIADDLMERFPSISGLWLKVSKRLPPLALAIEQVGVEIVRKREPD